MQPLLKETVGDIRFQGINRNALCYLNLGSKTAYYKQLGGKQP